MYHTIIAVLFLVQRGTASSNGIIGFGRSLYPDLCCQACHDSLSALYLDCTSFSVMDGMSMGTTSDDCHMTNEPWLQTMAYCIQQECNKVGYVGDKKQAKCFKTQAVMGASSPPFQESLPSVAPTVELAANATWLNETSLVNSDLYSSTYGTEGEFARSEYMHTRYSVINILTAIGLCVCGGVVAQSRSVSPRFQSLLQNSRLYANLQQNLFLPALFGSRRLEPLPGSIGYIPGRTVGTFIGVYIIMNIILCSVSFRTFQPNTFFLSKGFELCEYVGNRTGTLSLVNMSIAILFASRNNLLEVLTGWSQTTFLTLHRWAARVATLQAMVHSIVYTMAYWEPAYDGAAAYAAKVAMPFYYWGIIATIAMSLILPFAALPFRIKYYEIFLITHIALVILTLIGCWYHIVPHFGYIYGYQTWLYMAFGFWAGDRFIRFLRLGYYNRLGDSKAIVEALPGCDIMQVTVFPRVAWNFGPGQHTFLYLPDCKWWQSHPFSIAGWRRQGPFLESNDSQEGENQVGVSVKSIVPNQIHFLIRPHNGMTSALRQRVRSSPSPYMGIQLSIYSEGPYAGHRARLHLLTTADTILCLAGGIGITNALGYIQEYTEERKLIKKAKRFILAWSAREPGLIEHVKMNFLAGKEGIECSFWCTKSEKTTESDGDESRKLGGTEVGDGRMNVGEMVRSSAERGYQTTVLVCGPGKMADEATAEVVKCLKDGYRMELVEEAFAW